MTSFNQPNNILQQVTTYQRGGNALLQNLCCLMNMANKKFKNFEDIRYNLGSTVNFDVPPKATTVNGLQAVFQPSTQRLASLAVSQAANASMGFDVMEILYNVEKPEDNYREVFGESYLAALGNKIETNLALHCASAAFYGTQAPSLTGQPIYKSGPYRFGLNGSTPLTSYQQLQQMMANFIEPGAVTSNFNVVLPNTIVPSVIGTSLNQFVPRRNDDIAMSWELGEFGFPKAKYFQSNLLPTHNSGNVGNATSPSNQLTVVSTNDPTGTSITQITFSGATGSDANAIFAGDRFTSVDIASQPNTRLTTFFGEKVTRQPVQFRAIANAGANSGGQVTVNIYPALSNVATANFASDTQSINTNIVAGMKFAVMPSHDVGIIISDNAFFMAMPQLPDQDPFNTANAIDKTTGATLRLTKGSQFGGDLYGWIYDVVWDALMLPEYCYAILLPLSQS